MKKIAVLIYPGFSMQEISCLTDALSVFFEQSIDVFASTDGIITSEDHFQCIANKTLDEFEGSEYSCIILPGIYNPLIPLFDAKLTAFLEKLKGTDILIAAISSAPLLLAKAGLLNDVHFTGGFFEEMCSLMDFIPRQNRVRRPVVRDKNIITAIGFAFREFACEVIRALGLDECEGGIYKGVDHEFGEEDLTFYMGEEAFAEFAKEYEEYL